MTLSIRVQVVELIKSDSGPNVSNREYVDNAAAQLNSNS